MGWFGVHKKPQKTHIRVPSAEGSLGWPQDLLAFERVVAVIDDLSCIYTPCGVGIWLLGANQLLDGRRPVDLLREGEIGRVERAVPKEQIAT